MSDRSAQHSTIVLARTYNAPIARVFAAVSDPSERRQVVAGCQIVSIEFEQSDLRKGGRDVVRFGHRAPLGYRGESHYHDVVPERRIVCTDSVFAGEMRLWVGVTTLEFVPAGQRTQLRVTIHRVWLEDDERHEGADALYAAWLDGLERYLNDG